MSALPIGTLIFSGFGDDDTRCTTTAGVSVTPPTGARIGNTTGITSGQNGCTGLIAISANRFFVAGTSYNEFPDQIVEAILDTSLDGYLVAVPNTAPPYVTNGQSSGAAVDENGNAYWLAGSASHAATVRQTTPLGVVTVVGNLGVSASFANGWLGVNQAGTIAYYARRQEFTVHSWDLSGDVALPDFVTVTGAGANNIGAICVLPDDTVLIGWDESTSGATLIRYDAAGMVLTTYVLPDTYARATWIAAAVDLTTGDFVSDRFIVAYYSSASGYGVTVAEVDTVAGTVLNSFATTAGAFEWDGPFALSREVATPQPVPPGPEIAIPMRKLRRSTTFSTEKVWNFFTRFQLDFQAGGPRDGNDPIEICLRYSDDNGNTWSDELWLTVDRLGQYDSVQAQWFNLGRGRDRVWEVSSTSDAMTVWLAAYLDVIPGTRG